MLPKTRKHAFVPRKSEKKQSNKHLIAVFRLVLIGCVMLVLALYFIGVKFRVPFARGVIDLVIFYDVF